MWDLLIFFFILANLKEYLPILLVVLGLFLIGGIYLAYLSKKDKSIAEQAPSFPTYEDSISSAKQIVMEKAPSFPTYEDSISSAKQTVREKALEIKDKMSKITGHLSIIKDMNTRDAKEIYDKEKNILTGLFDYYCKFQKVYSDLSFSQILNPVDITVIKKIDIKEFVSKIKILHKRDYVIAISSLRKEDTSSIKESYMQLENAIDNLTNTLINIQYNSIVQEISPIEQDVMLAKIINKLEPSLAITDYRVIEDNYLRYLDEFKAAKEIFK